MARKHKRQFEVLQQAIKDVSDRGKIYGDPLVNHTRVAILIDAWLSIRQVPAEPIDSVAIQILTNLARLCESPNHKGSWDNIAGYAEIGYKVTKC